MSELKIGDKVKILDGGRIGNGGYVYWSPSEDNDRVGLETRIIGIHSHYVNCYHLNLTGVYMVWPANWLELVED